MSTFSSPASVITNAATQWDVVYNVFSKGRNNDEKNTALRALGRSKNPENIKKTLALALNGEVKDQDVSVHSKYKHVELKVLS